MSKIQDLFKFGTRGRLKTSLNEELENILYKFFSSKYCIFFLLLRQTIYHRIENLLLDPGKKSTEKQQIIDSAVDNYHRQKMILPETDDGTTHYDITDLTGKELL